MAHDHLVTSVLFIAFTGRNTCQLFLSVSIDADLFIIMTRLLRNKHLLILIELLSTFGPFSQHYFIFGVLETPLMLDNNGSVPW